MQSPVILDKRNGGEIFWMCASANMAFYAIEMTKHEVNGNLVTLQPVCSQLFGGNDLIIKYDAEQTSMNSPSFIVFHYYLDRDVDVVQCRNQHAPIVMIM